MYSTNYNCQKGICKPEKKKRSSNEPYLKLIHSLNGAMPKRGLSLFVPTTKTGTFISTRREGQVRQISKHHHGTTNKEPKKKKGTIPSRQEAGWHEWTLSAKQPGEWRQSHTEPKTCKAKQEGMKRILVGRRRGLLRR